MYILFQKGTKGGISDISNRYSKANNKYLKSFWPEKGIKTYLASNNLYGYVMFKFVPARRFKLIDPKHFDLSKYPSSHAIKYTSHLFEVQTKHIFENVSAV